MFSTISFVEAIKTLIAKCECLFENIMGSSTAVFNKITSSTFFF